MQVFVTATGRCIDLATAIVGETHVLLIVSPSMREELLQRFDKFIFPADRVKVGFYQLRIEGRGWVKESISGNWIIPMLSGCQDDEMNLLQCFEARGPLLKSVS